MNPTIDPTEDTDTPEDAGTGRRLDPELKTIGAILRMLDGLDEAARCRVVAYLAAREEGRNAS